MAYTLKEFLNRPPPKDPRPKKICVFCQQQITSFNGPAEKTSDGFACSDCYFDELGKIMEQYPPGLPINPRFK